MMRVLTLTILMLSLTACAASPIIQTKTVYRYPPTALTEPTPVPDYMGKQWSDLADYTVTIKSRLLQCNADKSFIRDWGQPNDR